MADSKLLDKPIVINPSGGYLYIVVGGIDYRIDAKDLTTFLYSNETVISADYTAQDHDYNVIATIPGITVSLEPSPTSGKRIYIINDSSGDITVDGNGNLIYDVSTFTLLNGETLSLIYGNNKWYLI